MTNLNPIVHGIADAMEIEPGSAQWLNGGMAAMSGQTGGQPSYGWRHDHRLSDSWVRSVLANYGHRPCYYDDEPLREAGYEKAGRPEGWTPEIAGDLPTGQIAYIRDSGAIVKVSGPDIQHCWLDPLLAVADSGKLFMVKWDGKLWPAGKLARVMLPLLVDSIAGQIRKYFKYTAGGRATARILDTFIQASKRNCVSEESATLILEWLDKQGFPQLERAPGLQEVKNSGKDNFYQDVFWMTPPLHDSLEALKNFPDLATRARAILVRLCQYHLDVEAIGQCGCEINQMVLTPALLAGNQGKPLPTLVGAVTKADMIVGGISNSWALRSADIARLYVPGAAAEAMFTRIKAKVLPGKVADKPFLCDRDREWL